MRRWKQELPFGECEKVLHQERRGVLAVQGEGGYPYAVPINFLYEPGHLYFHGALEGHKVDALRANPHASFCTWDAGYRKVGKRGLNVRSVVAFGTVRFLESESDAREKCRLLGMKYFPDEPDYVDKELERSAPRLLMLDLSIEHVTGKLVNES
ncbi:MAG: pyridoxamine 5'-phosphate oxidase family protein [Eggerthellaceae bacterium]